MIRHNDRLCSCTTFRMKYAMAAILTVTLTVVAAGGMLLPSWLGWEVGGVPSWHAWHQLALQSEECSAAPCSQSPVLLSSPCSQRASAMGRQEHVHSPPSRWVQCVTCMLICSTATARLLLLAGGRAATRNSSPLRSSLSHARLNTDASVNLPDLFKSTSSGIASLRPQYTINTNNLDAEESRQPKLLQRLEALLDDKLSLIDNIGAGNKGFAAIQLRTDAHRQAVYDAALDDALASIYDSVHMRGELAIAEERLDTALRKARQTALEDATKSRKEIQDEIVQHTLVAEAAEQRCAAAEAEIQASRAHTARLREQEAALLKQNAEAKQAMLAASSFAENGLTQQAQGWVCVVAGVAGHEHVYSLSSKAQAVRCGAPRALGPF
ncbi:TSNAXIP1_N domain-containing protein [Haematococcus lacustris]|uniref:TSNAXIP1_N domain-containing protein n=1 Tax=Haematococcus lacustris TaxID=44745 RepID=A0A699YHH6_HAELA|nr:TSNAXIP1_N domain-containing protein [Haematococcus lacustris]